MQLSPQCLKTRPWGVSVGESDGNPNPNPSPSPSPNKITCESEECTNNKGNAQARGN